MTLQLKIVAHDPPERWKILARTWRYTSADWSHWFLHDTFETKSAAVAYVKSRLRRTPTRVEWIHD